MRKVLILLMFFNIFIMSGCSKEKTIEYQESYYTQELNRYLFANKMNYDGLFNYEKYLSYVKDYGINFIEATLGQDADYYIAAYVDSDIYHMVQRLQFKVDSNSMLYGIDTYLYQYVTLVGTGEIDKYKYPVYWYHVPKNENVEINYNDKSLVGIYSITKFATQKYIKSNNQSNLNMEVLVEYEASIIDNQLVISNKKIEDVPVIYYVKDDFDLNTLIFLYYEEFKDTYPITMMNGKLCFKIHVGYEFNNERFLNIDEIYGRFDIDIEGMKVTEVIENSYIYYYLDYNKATRIS